MLLFLLLVHATSGPELEVIGRAQQTAGVTLTSDSTLARGAACLAKFSRRGQALTAGLVRYCADVTGVYESVLVPLVGESGQSQQLEQALTKFFRTEAKMRALSHYGAANARDEGSQTIAVLASHRRGTFDLQPGDICKERRARFSGEVISGHSNLRAFLTLPNGSVTAMLVEQKGRSYKGEAMLDSGNGRYQVEVLADTKEGPHVVANRALFVCTKAPDKPPQTALGKEGADKDKRMLALMNVERKRIGAPELVLDPEVSAIAEAHAHDMRAKNYFAHTSKDGATLGERLKRSGVAYLRATENLSSAPTAEDAHFSLMGSPGHRKNVLDPEVTHVGIGVVSQPLSNGEPNYLFVIDFYTPAPDVNPNAFRELLLTTLNQERAQQRMRPITTDPALDTLAKQHSEGMSRRDELAYVPDENRFFGEIRALKGNVEGDADLFVTNDPAALRKSQNVHKPAKAVGIGVTMGASKRYGDRVFWVTIIYVRDKM